MGRLLLGILRAGKFTVPSLGLFSCFSLRRKNDGAECESTDTSPTTKWVETIENRLISPGSGYYRDGRTSTDFVSSIAAVLAYLARRGLSPGLLFVFENGLQTHDQ